MLYRYLFSDNYRFPHRLQHHYFPQRNRADIVVSHRHWLYSLETSSR